MKKPVIVCVDDEKFVLDSLRTTLERAFGDNYLIEIAEDGADALGVVKELLANGQDVPVIISDYVMPQMRGDELLSRIQIISQQTLKIMLTGQANIEGVANAVNEGGLYQFISKPWNNSHLIQIVQNAVQSYFAAKDQQDRSNALIELMPDLVLQLGGDGLILNQLGEAAEGGLSKIAEGKYLKDVFPIEIAQLYLEKIHSALSDGQIISFEYHLETPAGLKYFETRITSCGSDCVLAVARDISAKKLMEAALMAATKEANEASKAKSSFLATMSHEIRTPLNSVLGFSDLLMDTQLNVEQRDFANTIHKSAEALLCVIGDILDFSKIEAGRLELEKTPFCLREEIKSSLSIITPSAETKHLTIRSKVDDRCPDRLVGDVVRLRQVVINLVANAVKFTEQGVINVSVTAPETEESTSVKLKFEVQDSGIGISEEQQRQIFAPFIQADASTTRRFGGTGLGLAISRCLVELMGGSLSVTSEPGKGSVFSFTISVDLDLTPSALLPETPPDSPSASNVGLDSKMGMTHPLRILLAEDNPMNRKILNLLLGRMGYHPDFATDGIEAVNAINSKPYDVILMDIQMPMMDGLEATKIIRKEIPSDRQPKIIALTAHAFEDDRLQCIKAGMDDYLTKPINRNLLAEALQRVCKDLLV